MGKAELHSELPRAETQHLNTVCHFAAIGRKELTGGFSRKTQQNGYFDAFSNANKNGKTGSHC